MPKHHTFIIGGCIITKLYKKQCFHVENNPVRTKVYKNTDGNKGQKKLKKFIYFIF